MTNLGGSPHPIDVLSAIYAAKRDTLARERALEPYECVERRAKSRRSERRPFAVALRRATSVGVIAEIKRASPSAGTIAADFHVVERARSYADAGADAISVLTERDYFMGELAYLDVVRGETDLPVLRKDFLWTPYQIAQSAAYGADCVLLIVAGLSNDSLRECLEEARRWNLDVLVEVHDEFELARAIGAGADLIGVNNRDLRTLFVDVSIGERLLPQVPAGSIAISESGIGSSEDAARLYRAGARAFLIGEAMMRTEKPSTFVSKLREVCRDDS